jgi:hypothetical protein
LRPLTRSSPPAIRRRGSATTVTVLRDAARTALRRGASDSAVVLLRRAFEESCPDPQRVEPLVELGLAETLVDGPSAAVHLAESFAALEEPTPRRRGSAGTGCRPERSTRRTWSTPSMCARSSGCAPPSAPTTRRA